MGDSDRERPACYLAETMGRSAQGQETMRTRWVRVTEQTGPSCPSWRSME
jgi:hypothetical protein